MQIPVAEIVDIIAERHRVLVLGGLAVIAHGLSRTTHDSDIWLDPLIELSEWCDIIRQHVGDFPGVYFYDVFRKDVAAASELEKLIDQVGMVRIGGLDRYLGIFRLPNQLEVEDFSVAWNLATFALGNARVMDESFLIATKIDTGRVSDQDDISFLEKKLRAELAPAMERSSLAEAETMFSRYADHVTCLAALRNPDPAVQALGRHVLEELAEANNPFAREALARLGNS